MELVLIPGAYSSPYTWSYLQTQLPAGIHPHCLKYDTEAPIEQTLEKSAKLLKKQFGSEELCLVGHSLGGILAFSLSHRLDNISGTVASASPFGGLMLSRFMHSMTYPLSLYVKTTGKTGFFGFDNNAIEGYQNFWDNIHPNNRVLKHLRETPLRVPGLTLIMELSNMNIWMEPSDGTVSTSSQMALGEKHNLRMVKFEGNHQDGVLHPGVISEVSKFYHSLSPNEVKPSSRFNRPEINILQVS